MADNDNKIQIDADIQDGEVISLKAVSNKTWLVWLALLLVLLGSLGGSWWLYRDTQAYRQAQQQLRSSLQNEDVAVKKSLAAKQQQIDELKMQEQQLQKLVTELQSTKQLSSEKLLRQWALQEVQYLLNLANQRARVANDVLGAIQALTLADNQLAKLNDYQLHPLRSLIADELLALESVADIDITGMALQLQAATKAVDTLWVVKGPKLEVQDDTQATATTDEVNRWQQAMADIWSQIKSLVVIRHDQSGAAAVLVPEQRYFLYQNLKLQLESARMALMNHDEASYQHSLQTAEDWLAQYFVGDERDALLHSLQTLRGTNISIVIPDISASLSWMEAFER